MEMERGININVIGHMISCSTGQLEKEININGNGSRVNLNVNGHTNMISC